MKRYKYVSFMVTVFALCSFFLLPRASGAAALHDGYCSSLMPPCEPKLIASLRNNGIIPEGATEIEAKRTYLDYVKQKVGSKPEDRAHPKGAQHISKGEGKGKHQRRHGRMKPDKMLSDNILILSVEFSGGGGPFSGPLHNEIPKPDRTVNNFDFWIPDFSKEHYQHMLFDRSPRALSMSNYFIEQSGGVYTVDGIAYEWVTVSYPEWWYGADNFIGIDNYFGPVWRLVQDAVTAAGDSIPWADFDTEDPYDLDGDGNLEEPDGYVDHIMIVHAGAGQEGGGGLQGDLSIWSHSWWADAGIHGPGLGGVQTSNPDVWVGAYTMMPEDGTIGVFCHEFIHDLGLPDEYDTIYSGDPSTGFWSIMGFGGWLSLPKDALGTCPSNLSIWGKYVLGWVDPIEVNPGDRKKSIRLMAAEERGQKKKAIKINLPDYAYTVFVNTPHSPENEWYSDKGDNLNNTLTLPEVSLSESSTLTFWTWYDIETDWDYGCVEKSSDGGATWETIPGNITTDDDPYGQNPGHGITGNSGGWKEAVFYLSGYTGTVSLRFRYWTDAAYQGQGWTIDDIKIRDDSGEVIFADDVESGPGDWLAAGWFIFGGSMDKEAFHYYLAEWREPIGFDASMRNWNYSVDYRPPDFKIVGFFPANPGMLLWYRDGQFSLADNWVGLHPWRGFLLAVDSHPELILAEDLKDFANDYYYYLPIYYGFPYFPPDNTPPDMGVPFRTRISIVDATFGLKKTAKSPLISWYGIETDSEIPRLKPVAVFDDSKDYFDTRWSPWFWYGFYDFYYDVWQDLGYYIRFSINSVDTPTYGLRIEVKKEMSCGALIEVDFSGWTP